MTASACRSAAGPVPVWWASVWGGAVVRVSLTLGTLEDMAEACGLPRTPEPRGQHAEQHAGYKAALDAFCGVVS